MDWITLLKSLQSDFIQRLKSGCTLHCKNEGQHSELTIISGQRLKSLREFCWIMAEKYKRTSPVRDVFISNLKGKLGEEVVKERLADLITEVDYEKRLGGDGGSDFTLTSNSEIGVEVKSRHGKIDNVRWSVSAEEVAKNAVVVCVLIQEEVNEAQTEYNLFLAGFLPTKMIKLKRGRIAFGIEQLLYAGGLVFYLQRSDNNQETVEVKSLKNQSSEKLASHDFKTTPKYQPDLQAKPDDAEIYYQLGLVYYQSGDYQTAIINYSQAININQNYSQAYHQRGLANYQLGNYQAAIEDYHQALKVNPHDIVKNKHEEINPLFLNHQHELVEKIVVNADDAIGYENRGHIRCEMGDYEGGIADYNQAIKINDNFADAYYCRGNAYFDLGKYEAAIYDFTQVIKISYSYSDAYYNRGHSLLIIGDKQAAIDDFRKAADLYWQDGKLAEHQETQAIILDLEIEQSLDILNF